MKTGAIIQARTTSTRLPNKILKELPYGSGITVLQQVIRRVKRSKKIDEIIIATTTDNEDDGIVDIAKKEGVKCFRGSKQDVLERYFFSAKEYALDIIVRITSDCPCIDSYVVDLVIERHINTMADYTSNTLLRTFPHGLDVEAINFTTIKKAHIDARDDFEREHVTQYIYKTNPNSFKITAVKAPEELSAPDIRITLDTEEDYALLCAVFDYLYSDNEFFGIEKIIKLFNERPWLRFINMKVLQKKIFETIEDEIREAVKYLELQDYKRVKKILENYSKDPH